METKYLAWQQENLPWKREFSRKTEEFTMEQENLAGKQDNLPWIRRI